MFIVYQVAEGQEVCILEAMKMQNSLQASKVSKVSIQCLCLHEHMCMHMQYMTTQFTCPCVCLAITIKGQSIC